MLIFASVLLSILAQIRRLRDIMPTSSCVAHARRAFMSDFRCALILPLFAMARRQQYYHPDERRQTAHGTDVDTAMRTSEAQMRRHARRFARWLYSRRVIIRHIGAAMNDGDKRMKLSRPTYMRRLLHAPSAYMRRQFISPFTPSGARPISPTSALFAAHRRFGTAT